MLAVAFTISVHLPWYIFTSPGRFVALFNYAAQNSDELDLLEGDLVLVAEKCDDGWFVGRSLRTNELGTFPGNYVKAE